jgi:CAAX prenyl protease-like protein
MGFIALESLLRWLAASESGGSGLLLWLYAVRTAVVVASLVYFWPAYRELRNPLCANWREGLLVVVVGVAVYVAWVRMDWPWAMQGQSTGYNPFQAGANAGLILAGIRLFGAAAVVPLMEELFWRSFLIRYLVASPFTAVRLGTFTPLSFGATVVLFGLEHHLWLAGMMAGAAYNLLLIKTGRLWPCVLAHAITNLMLGLHVLVTAEWYWW